MTLTLYQIDEIRAGHEPSLSLQQAARLTGLNFMQCPECRGNGYTRETLLASARVIERCKDLNELVPIQYERCRRCDGTGGWIVAT